MLDRIKSENTLTEKSHRRMCKEKVICEKFAELSVTAKCWTKMAQKNVNVNVNTYSALNSQMLGLGQRLSLHMLL